MKQTTTQSGSIALPFILSICLILLPIIYFESTISHLGRPTRTQSMRIEMERTSQSNLLQFLNANIRNDLNAGEIRAIPSAEIFQTHSMAALSSNQESSDVKTSLAVVLRTGAPSFPNIPWRSLISKGRVSLTRGQHEENSHKLSLFTCLYGDRELAGDINCAGNLTMGRTETSNQQSAISLIATGDCELTSLVMLHEKPIVLICNGNISISRLELSTKHPQLIAVSGGTMKIAEVIQQSNEGIDGSVSLHAKNGITLRGKRTGAHFPERNTTPLNAWPKFSIVGIR